MTILELQSNLPLVYRILDNQWVRAILAPTTKDKLGLGKMMGSVLTLLISVVRIANISSRVAQRVVAERFKPDSKDRPDMLGSFLRHGLTQPQAEAESLIQMYGKHLVLICNFSSSCSISRC